MRWLRLACALAVAPGGLGACRGGEPDRGPSGLVPPSGCDPLDPALCALPFPSSYFQVEADTPSGVRNAFGPKALPRNRDLIDLVPDAWNALDGFSTMGPVLTWFDDVSLDGVIGHADLSAYLAADAKTVILDASTGERVPHFVELDVTSEDPHQRLLMIRPVVPMAHGTRHVVGIRGLTRTGGGPVAVSPAFAALRDGTPTDLADVEDRRARFDAEVFPLLEAAGFARDELQLAWDFTTVSRESSLGPILHIRDDALSRLPPGGPAYTITSVEDGDCGLPEETIARTVYGEVTVPRYTVSDGPGLEARFALDGDGLPTYQGEAHPAFMIRIPCSVAEDPDPGARGTVLQYGHGLLGDLSEGRTGWLSSLADEYGYIVLAMDWTGMSARDAGYITLMLATDVSDFPIVPERSQQGFVEWVYGLRMMTESIVDDPAVSDFSATTGRQGTVIDPERVAFYGNSQGAILGGAYTAISPDLERVVLGVGGAPYSLLLSRSIDFDPFFLLFKNKYLDHREITLILGLVQTLWDPAESAGYLGAMNADPLPGTPPKRVLLQVAVGDSQVTTLGAHVTARAYGASSVAPAHRAIWGVEEQAAPFEGSAIVEWYYEDGAVEPVENAPPAEGGDTHECPRREPEARQQLAEFLATGVVNQHCEGVCTSRRAGLCD